MRASFLAAERLPVTATCGRSAEARNSCRTPLAGLRMLTRPAANCAERPGGDDAWHAEEPAQDSTAG